MRDAVVGVDVLDDGGLAVEHRPAADARRHREPLPLPQRADGVLVGVVAAVAVAEDERGAVGAGEAARGAADDILHGRKVAGQREPLNDLDEVGHAVGQGVGEGEVVMCDL